MSPNYLLKCTTNDAYVIKTLIELLHHTIKVACFQITPVGISLRMMDRNQQLLIDCVLKAENFFMYHFSTKVENQCINIGINLNHFYRMLKSIKKRDTLSLYILEDNVNDLGIEILPKDHTRKTISLIKIQSIENLEIELPHRYTNSILVPSNEFSKMCKDMISISSTIRVRSKKYTIGFYSDVHSIFSREVFLGNTDNEINDDNEFIFEDTFETEHISRILKISGLHQNINLYYESQMPFLIQSKVGSLGYISLYLKSKNQIEEENYLVDGSS